MRKTTTCSFFFFSSRRRHTRFKCDWSSDVCSSDLLTPEGFKILSLCESGYTFTFLPTSRVSSNDVPRVNGLNKVGCLVHYLVTQLPYHRLSYNVYMDNYFSNVPLYQNLRQIGIGACGTVRKTASRFPKELKIDKNAKLDWDVRSGIVVNE